MADLFLHLGFARRLRTADGLHPIVGEALARRAGLVAFAAAVAQLPQHERQSLGFFRRLFGGGSDAARWQKQLTPVPGQVRTDLIAAVLTPSFDKAERGSESRRETAEGAPGSMQRLALALGLLAHDLLEIAVAASTSSVSPPERGAVERAQARLWLQTAVPNAQELEREWRPIAELAEAEAYKAGIAHLDRALHRAFKVAPGEAVITRWMKRLAADVAPVVDVQKSAGLPVTLTVADAAARGPHFEDAAFVEKVQSAVSRFVVVANRVAEQLLEDAPPERVLAHLSVALGLGADMATVTTEIETARARWREWQQKNRTAALERGRNPKPAYEESLGDDRPPEGVPSLPPEAGATGAPPLPDLSGPNVPPPTMTQEVSLAQIEAEAAEHAAASLPAPPHTQEISAAQIESAQSESAQSESVQSESVQSEPGAPGSTDSAADEFEAPPHTQEVSVAQIEELRPTSSTTQPISADDILLARSSDTAATDASSGAPAPSNGSSADGAASTSAALPGGSDAEPAAPTPAHTEGAAADVPPAKT